MSAACTACEKSEFKVATYLDTYAAAFAGMEDFDSAVEWQKKAIECADKSDNFPKAERSSLDFRLELYKNKIKYTEAPQEAILKKYQDITGARLSDANLRDVSADQRSKLIEYLRMIPERNYLIMATGHDITREHWDLVLLILTTESMDHKERDKWFRSIPDMDSTNIDKLRGNMIEEREKLDATDKEYQERISQK